MLVLVINAGSSSLKYALVDPETGERSLSGLVERIGEPGAPVSDHRQAFGELRSSLAAAGATPAAVGHRVVHGGDHFTAPALIDDAVVAAIEQCVPLAPLHNPAALAGINAARAEFPDLPQVAVFDTAFHTTIPDAARYYALDPELARAHHLRRYGFHGTSHQYVADRAARVLDRPIEELNIVSLHLGNGASACAIRGGISVETSMGTTPLEGLIMGTRSGDVDPAIPLMLVRAGMTVDEVDELLNKRSGLRALCGDNDMRIIHERAEQGDAAADLAREMFAHRLRKYLGAYLAVLGEVDAVVFTAGIGEHDWWTRERVCSDLEPLGIGIDVTANRAAAPGVISRRGTPVTVMVVPTDEERAIAEQTAGRLTDAARTTTPADTQG